MNKLTQLFIRACKSKDPVTRLESVYRRFYCASLSAETRHFNMKTILLKICSDYGLVDVVRLADDLDFTAKSWKYGKDITYSYFSFRTVITYIRFAEVVKLPGLTSPIKFRRN